MVCKARFIHVYANGISNLFPERPYIPRHVTGLRHDVENYIFFKVKPFVTYSELHPWRKKKAKSQCGFSFSFDEARPEALDEDDFKVNFLKFIEGYESLEIHGTDEAVEYFRDFVKDKIIFHAPRQKFRCECRNHSDWDD
jgi:hypothetical protein